MTEDQAAEAAALIRARWDSEDRLAALPGALRPATRAEGYRIQAHLAGPDARYGWKIAATSIAGQRHIGVDGPLAGRILPERVRTEGDLVPFGANRMRVAEPEFAFRLARDLPARPEPYADADILAAVDTLHPAWEIPDSRFADPASAGGPQLIADLACGRDFMLGQPAPAGWRDLDLAAHPMTARRNDGAPIPGIGANVLGDPRRALAWIVEELRALGIGLTAGQVITTGVCCIPIPIAPHDQLSADFGPLGRIDLRFGA